MNQRDIDTLETAFPDLRLQRDVPWKKISILGVGASVKFFAEPADDLVLVDLLKYCTSKNIPLRTIGAGSNIVGSDSPFDGIVIRLMRHDFSLVIPNNVYVTVGAGAMLGDFLKKSAAAGLGGAAGLAGIPGTVGGAIRMNAGAHGIEMKDIVEEVCGYAPDGSHWSMDAEKLNWQYRKVNIPSELIITAAICRLSKVDFSEELTKIESELSWRAKHCPSGRSTGCVFRNPFPDISAGKLIDNATCRGKRIGGAVISDIHANYILNDGEATEKEYVDLIIEAKNRVFEESGISLKPEVCFMDPATAKRIDSISPKINVVVLKGGDSSEREISLISGKEVEKALKGAGYNVVGIDIKHLNDWHNLQINSNSDIVFPVLHGGFGENGEIQSLMEKDGVAFVGCDAKACHLSMNKIDSKKLMEKSSLPTPDYAVVTREDHSFPEKLNFPVVVKPPEGGSTVGISIVSSLTEWEDALTLVFECCDVVLVEEFIEGKEITVSIVGDQVLPVVEIQFPGRLFDYDAKYEHSKGETRYLCPPETISCELQKKAQEISFEFAKVLNARDLIRIDLIIDQDDNITILEANNMPGFTPGSLLPKSAAQEGISFPQLCKMLVQRAAKRRKC